MRPAEQAYEEAKAATRAAHRQMCVEDGNGDEQAFALARQKYQECEQTQRKAFLRWVEEASIPDPL